MKTPIALTIAGSDSGGGAGIQADLKTFTAYQVFGTSVITCVTAQNPSQIQSIFPLPPKEVEAQLEAIFSWQPVGAVKTGMLYSSAILQAISNFWKNLPDPPPLVIDPVMVSTSGRLLLQEDAQSLLRAHLLPKATLITPNHREAELLGQASIHSLSDMRRAAEQLHQQFGSAILVKGGHLPHQNQAIDVFYDGIDLLELASPFLTLKRTHGTGCTLSAAITAGLAQGWTLKESVRHAKTYLTSLLQQAIPLKDSSLLLHFQPHLELPPQKT